MGDPLKIELAGGLRKQTAVSMGDGSRRARWNMLRGRWKWNW